MTKYLHSVRTFLSSHWFAHLSLALVFLSLFGSPIWAQSGAGSIQGTVTDATGAIIPGANIHVVNEATGVSSDTKSNSVGFYQVPNLFAGHYSVTVVAQAMKTAQAKVELLVAQTAVVSPVMTAGAVTQEVQVSADAVQLTTKDSATISSTLENQRINQLPMNGRSLYSLTGDVVPGLEGGTRANGLEGEALEYVADGAPLVNRNFGSNGNSTQAQLPDPDSVQEVRIETSNSSAQFATPGTAIITTKSGTNSLHGSIFETARNNAIGIAKNRNNPSNFSAPHLVRNEFGVSIGGPVILPKIYDGRDKTFWFFSYERFSLAQNSYQLNTTFTQAMRNGDWSGLVSSAGILQQLYDPNTTAPSSNCNGSGTANNYCRLPFGNNQIPLNRMSPASKVLFSLMPLPTSSANPLVANNLNSLDDIYQTVPTIAVRIDQNFNEANKAYVRFGNNVQTAISLRDNPSEPASVAGGGIPAGASGPQNLVVKSYSGSVGYTHIFSPSFFAETVVSQQWFHQYFYNGSGSTHDINYEQLLGLPNNFDRLGLPDIGGSDTGAIGGLFGNQLNYGETQLISNIDENLSKTLGKHQLTFGGRYRHERFAYNQETHDQVDFDGLATGLENPGSGANYSTTANTGSAAADYFLGAASSYTNYTLPFSMHFHDMEFDAYFQDNFHVTQKLTLNLGVRYEAHPAAWMKDGMLPGFDLKNDALVLDNPPSYYISKGIVSAPLFTNLTNIGAKIETPAEAGLPSTIMKNADLIFAPRLGFAYLPFGDKRGTVIRGGFGRYIYPVPTRNAFENIEGNVPYQASYAESYTAANQSPDGLPNYLLRAPQSVIMGVNSSNVVNSNSTTSLLPGTTLWTTDSNYNPDIVSQTSFTIEQPLKGQSVFRISYLLTQGQNLDGEYLYNAHPSPYVYEMQTGTTAPTGNVIGSPTYAATATGPYDKTTWGSNALAVKNGWSNDNALQANYERFFNHGIAYQIAYVWSKPFRVGGNWTRDGVVTTAADYFGNSGGLGKMTSPYGTVIAPALPPARPAGLPPYAEWHGLASFEQKIVDTSVPKQHISFNGILDLPFGTGKRFLGNSNRFVNEIVGGFQIAGIGNVVSQDFAVASANWGPTNPLKIYKHKVPITDCRSGVCYKEFQWFNGYIAPTAINGNPCATSSAVVSGLRPDYAPYSQPIDTDCVKTDAAYKYYNSNEVAITLLNGTTSALSYSPGPTGSNPYSHTVINGPMNYSVDLSIFKVFPITKSTYLRINVDAFNAFNIQGYNNPNATDGTESVQPGVGQASSYNTPRQIQITARLTF